jgi:outer membrane protein, heavy metal efflux system
VHARILVLALAASAARCEQPPPLNLAQLIQEALDRNPSVLAAQKRYEAMAQRPRAATALPDPTLGVGYNSSGYPWPGAGLGTQPTANIGFMVTQELPYPGKRELRVKMASKEAQAEWQNYLAAQLTVIAQLKVAYYKLQHSYSMLDVLERNREVLNKMLQVAEVRYGAGKGTQQDVFRTQTQISILETRRVQIQRDQRSAAAELDSVLNRPPESPLGKPPEAFVHEELPPLNEILVYAKEHAPAIGREQRMIERSEVALSAARKDYYPDFAVTGGYYNMGSMPPMYTFRADVKIPVWSKRLRAGVTEQANTVAEARRNYESAQNSLTFRIQDEYLAAESAKKLMDIYASTVIPQANLALESALAGYQAGQGDFMGVLQNFMTSVEYEMNFHEEMQNFHSALARIEEMSAMPLTHTSEAP